MVRVAQSLARAAPVPRLHPSQDDPGGERGADRARPAAMPTGCRSTSSCRPKASLERLAPEKRATVDPARDGGAAAADRRGEERAQGAALRARRPEHADDRRRRRRDDADDPRQFGHALCGLRPAAGLLFGLQPDPRREPGRCRSRRRRLLREHRLYQADWLLRFYGFAATRSSPVRGRHARPRARPEARLGAAPPRALPGRRQPGRARACCCACRASASAASTRHPGGAPRTARCASTTSPASPRR